MQDALVIEIKNLETVEFVKLLCPVVAELDYEKDLKGNFFVLGPVPLVFSILTPQTVKNSYDRIENVNLKLKLLKK